MSPFFRDREKTETSAFFFEGVDAAVKEDCWMGERRGSGCCASGGDESKVTDAVVTDT